jgi:hypothetical protein
MNRMQAATAALISRMKATNGVEVTYTRGEDAVELTAWPGRTVFKRNMQEAAAILFGERDYLMAAAELVIGGSMVTPKKGDRITETIDGQLVTFEVQAPSDEPVWRYSDKTRMVLRIHCKRV